MLTVGLDAVEIGEIVRSKLSGAVAPEYAGEADDRVEGRSKLVAHSRKKVAFRLARRLGRVTSAKDSILVTFSVGNIGDRVECADDHTVGVGERAAGYLE